MISPAAKKDLTRRIQPFLPFRSLTRCDVTLLCVNLTIVPSPHYYPRQHQNLCKASGGRIFIYLNKASGVGGFERNERPIFGSLLPRLIFSGALKREFPVKVKDTLLTEVQGAVFAAAAGVFVREERGTSRAREGSQSDEINPAADGALLTLCDHTHTRNAEDTPVLGYVSSSESQTSLHIANVVIFNRLL